MRMLAFTDGVTRHVYLDEPVVTLPGNCAE
jgi:hypothetical protein